MGEARVIERIAAWEAAGLIDSDVAARLRAAEADRPADADAVPRNPIAAAGAFFGPAVTIAEMFGYLGTAFVLAAWYALVGRIAGGSPDSLIWVIGHAVPAVVFALLGAGLLRGSARARRAAGVAFLVSAGATAVALETAGSRVALFDPDSLRVVAAAGGLVAFAVFRMLHPALLTQVGLLAGLTTLAWAIQQWVEGAFFRNLDEFGQPIEPGQDPILRVALMAGWWLLVAFIAGLIGRREAAAGTIDADRRAALSRAWAGFLAVIGVTAAVLVSYYDPSASETRRILEPIIGDTAILAVSGVLLERAFRREASAYLYPAGLGVIVALTDLNASYLARATSTEVGLLVEGVILLAAGFAVERLRRRVGGGRGGPRPVSAETEPAPATISR
jgi:hypothetical protein